MNTSTQPRSDGLPGRLGAFVSFVVAACVLFALGSANVHAALAVGTVIGNQATATYNDAGGAPRSATSNLVTTTVSQVKAFRLTADGTRTAAPGQTVYYPHTIINDGNGTDTYTLVAPPGTGGSFTHTSLAYYLDANGDGVPDNNTPITTSGAIAAGGTFKFVVAGTVPAGATLNSTGTIVPSVTDTSGGAALSNTDTTTVASSVITFTKSLSVNSGPSPLTGVSPNGAITVTLSYTNSGNAAATNVQVTDILPAGMQYVTGTGRWSVSGATTLTEAGDGIEQAGSFPPGINYSTSGSTTVTAIIPSVPAGVSGTVSFQVNIAGGLNPGAVTNTATFQTLTQTPPSTTNPATYTVLRSAGVVANGASNTSVNSTVASPNPAALEPVQTTGGAGTTVLFNNYIWNRGNASDTFDITVSANSFPAGTSVTLLQQDGASTLLNSAGSPAPDTGPVPGQGAACTPPFVTDGTYCGYKVVVRVALPSNASGGPFSLTLLATSVFDTSQTDTVIDTVTSVSTNSVDLTNSTARSDSVPAGTAVSGGDGFGPGTAAFVVSTNLVPSTSATTSTTFLVYVNNVGFVNDSFDLTVTSAIPAGWTAQFYADGGSSCGTLGGSITNTGTINAGANRLVCARVTVPPTTSGQAINANVDFTFRAQSTTNPGVNDTIVDRVAVQAVHYITINPTNVQQTFKGGSVTYTHTITNGGNVDETVATLLFPGPGNTCLNDSRSGSGWTSAAYVDTNANGTLEIGTDTLITCGSTGLALTVGQSKTILVRVFAPGSANSTDPANTTTILVSYNGGTTASTTDVTSVTDGFTLLKEQAPVNCAAAGPHAGYITTPIASGPSTAPGQCIAYRITGTNTTAGTITSVVIKDIVPSNTTMKFSCSGNGAATPTVSIGAMDATSAADGATGTVTANVGTLTSTQAAVLYFCVRIDP